MASNKVKKEHLIHAKECRNLFAIKAIQNNSRDREKK